MQMGADAGAQARAAQQSRLAKLRPLDGAGLPTEISALGLDCDGAALADHMRHDKKAGGGTIPFILLRKLGEAYVARDVSLADVAAFMDEQLQAH